ncbi:MAG: hypothetical protein ACK44H_04025 [Candidatus Kryptonium sp.]
MRGKILLFLFFAVLVFNFSFGQNPEWVNFTAGDYITTLAIEGD